MKKLNFEQVNQIVTNCGCKLISKDYKNHRTKIEVEFVCGHIGSVLLQQLKDGSRLCSKCGYKNGSDKSYKKRINDEYNLLFLFPDLCKDWNYEKNNKSPDLFTPFSSQKVWWICSKGHTWETQIRARTISHCGCPYCSGFLASDQYNFSIMFPHLLLDWNYDKNLIDPSNFTPKSSKRVWWKCNKCHKEWKQEICVRANGHGCPFCKGNTKSKSLLKSSETFKNEIFLITFGEYELAGEYIKGNKKTKIKHNLCGTIFEITPNSILARKSGCPTCGKKFSGEEKVEKYLASNNILFEKHKPLINCKNINPLPFDFLIYDKNNNFNNIIIEFNGIQHYKPINFFGGIESFEKQKLRDSIKNNFCIENGINLIIIPYWEFENIEKILEKNFLLL